MPRRLSVVLFAVLTPSLALGSEALAQERDGAGATALRADVERIVASEEDGGWFLDAHAQEAIHATIMESFCRATPAARAEAGLVAAADAERAGDPQVLFERAGRERTRDVTAALHASRVRAALAAAEKAGADCPFWITPERAYPGRQTDTGRPSLSLETGGLLQVRQTRGSWTYGGGGVVRLLPGLGLGRVTLLAGLEFAGGAMLRVEGDTSQFVINYFPAIPAVVRVHAGNLQLDFETAAVSLFQADDGRLSYGGRLGFGLGFKALRTRFVLPWAGAAIAYEHYFDGGGRGPADFVRAGLRIGFQWVP